MLKNDTLKNGTSLIGLYGSAPPRGSNSCTVILLVSSYFFLHREHRFHSSDGHRSTQVTDIVKFYTFVQFLLLLFLGFIRRARTLSHSCIALFPSSESSETGNKYACAVSLF